MTEAALGVRDPADATRVRAVRDLEDERRVLLEVEHGMNVCAG